jgi:hypothetical protein
MNKTDNFLFNSSFMKYTLYFNLIKGWNYLNVLIFQLKPLNIYSNIISFMIVNFPFFSLIIEIYNCIKIIYFVYKFQGNNIKYKWIEMKSYNINNQ